LTTQVPLTQPPSEIFVTKPEIRHAGIVDVTFGKTVTVVQPVNLYGCTIGDGSFIGPFVEIQKGVTIGKRCRIQSHSFICELVTIGDECFISHGAMFINDLFVAGGPAVNPDSWRATRLGNRVSVGTNATILPVTICDQVVIGAGAVVTKDITEPGIYVGNPARLLRRLENSGVRT
jgi:acetyltransferase-like isoleucine patch superfamily enzyme